jgi:AraC-like DNA-binding protein
MSPLQYQKRLRLQEARRLMLGEGLDAAEAAFRVGYESPSQFSREYRRMFGAPPRQDVAALKVEARPTNARFHRGQEESIRPRQRAQGVLARR